MRGHEVPPQYLRTKLMLVNPLHGDTSVRLCPNSFAKAKSCIPMYSWMLHAEIKEARH